MKNIMSMIFVLVVFVLGFYIVTEYNENKIHKIYTIENLNLMIQNNVLKSDYERNTYNKNYTDMDNDKIYCNLNSIVQSFLINTYFYNFKDNINFIDFIYQYGYSNYYILVERR